MAIPDFQSIMLPFLKIAGDGQERHMRDVVETLAEHFKLSEDERKELLPSGGQTIFGNRVHWWFHFRRPPWLKSDALDLVVLTGSPKGR